MLKFAGLLFIILFISLCLVVLDKVVLKQLLVMKLEIFNPEAKKTDFPERIGERILYEVRWNNIKAGKAEFNHLAQLEMEGKKANLVTFQTILTGFNDLEKIYSDAQSFLPLKVEREVYFWPRKEKINEEYEQDNFTLKVTKFVGSKKQETVFKKHGPIHNAILMPFYVRRMSGLSPGWTLKANLPTQQFEIKLVDIEEVQVPAGKFQAYHFQSTPSRFEIWISADERRIPLKIKGSGGIGYVMSMTEYSL